MELNLDKRFSFWNCWNTTINPDNSYSHGGLPKRPQPVSARSLNPGRAHRILALLLTFTSVVATTPAWSNQGKTLLRLDASGSMWQRISDGYKFEIAQRALVIDRVCHRHPCQACALRHPVARRYLSLRRDNRVQRHYRYRVGLTRSCLHTCQRYRRV